jgi:5'(3')-deoxyribonucleotidase
LYRERYGDNNLKLSDWKTWDFHKYVKPECGLKIYDLISNEMISHMQPIQFSQSTTRELVNAGHQIFVITATQSQFLQKKVEFLYTYFPHINLDNLIVCKAKSLVNVDVLIDDNNTNIEKFPHETILFDQPWNQDCKKDTHRAKNWVDVKSIIKEIDEEKKRDKLTFADEMRELEKREAKKLSWEDY